MLSAELAKREEEGNPIRVGIIGAGKFGSGLVAQLMQTPGICAGVVADIDIARALYAYTAGGVPESEIATADSSHAINDALLTGRPVVAADAFAIAQAELVDVVVEATGLPDVGARTAYHAIMHKKHVVMVNVEADVVVGPILRRMADAAGVVYSLVDGDQPGVTMNLVEWARTLGFEIVAAGRGTTLYHDDPQGTPESVPERFGFDAETLTRRSINLRMFNSFRDGTKAQTEMTALANMAGLVPDVRGMHEPSVNIADVPRRFSLREEGGLLSQHGVVELANSVAEDGRTLLDNPLKMGVFVVIRAEHPFIREDLGEYFLHPNSNDHNFLLYRPYHLVAVEAPITIAKAVIYGHATGAPMPTPTAELVTLAKRDLRAGDIIDGGGGTTVLGACEKATVATAERLLPLGVANGARVKERVPAGETLTYDMVHLDEDGFALKLRRIQDATP